MFFAHSKAQNSGKMITFAGQNKTINKKTDNGNDIQNDL
jgi:hypothetical protein